MFRERMAQRKATEEVIERKSGRDSGEEEDEESDEDEDIDIDGCVVDIDGDGVSDLALLESQVIGIVASVNLAAQKEDWWEVLDVSSQVESLLMRITGSKVGACAATARILLNTGLKHSGGFADEPRVRSTIGCLMLVEWCVPTCPVAFRQNVASDRWIRKLVDLCRKDATEQQLVCSTVLQLIANWSSWYASATGCAGFEKACEMLVNEDYELPPAMRRPGDESGWGSGEARVGVGGAGLGVPGLQLQLQLPL